VRSDGAIALAAVAFGAIAGGAAILRLEPPAPAGLDAPAAEFSASRAAEHLDLLLREGPRPVGSPANARARDGLIAKLREMGLKPEVQSAFACAEGACAKAANVVVRLPGVDSMGTVLLSAHYDSVPAGPGAADDAAGVAALLEVLRALSADPAARNDVVVLFDDAEEAGLVGATAFVQGHPWAKDVRAVINLEARGTRGPSLLFETAGSAALLPLVSESLPHPVTSSLFDAIYRSLQSDTSFSPWQGRGLVAGANFAFIRGAAAYHTPRDDRAALDLSSVQHQGSQALALARALRSAELGALPSDGTGESGAATAGPISADQHRVHPPGDADQPNVVTTGPLPAEEHHALPPGHAVWFDLFSWRLVYWRDRLSLPLALAALAGTVLVTARLWRTGAAGSHEVKASVALRPAPPATAGAVPGADRALQPAGWWREVAASAALWLASPVAAGVVLGACRALQAVGLTDPELPDVPASARGASALVALGAVLLGTATWRRPPTPASGWAAVWLPWSVLALAAAVLAPFACFLLLVPALVASPCAAVWAWRPDAPLALLPLPLPAAVAGAVLLPPAWLCHDALGGAALPILAAATALVLLPALPWAAAPDGRGSRAAAGLLAITAGLAGLGFAMPRPTTSERAVNLEMHVDTDRAEARWVADTSDALAPAVTTSDLLPERGTPFPWWDGDTVAMSRPFPCDLDAPGLSILERRGGIVRARLRSQRGAGEITLLWPSHAPVTGLRVEGVRVPPSSGPWRAVTCHAVPPEGVGVTLEVADGTTTELVLRDRTNDLPPQAGAFLSQRPAGASPVQRGDSTYCYRRVALQVER
jgi:hypothetical protein